MAAYRAGDLPGTNQSIVLLGLVAGAPDGLKRAPYLASGEGPARNLLLVTGAAQIFSPARYGAVTRAGVGDFYYRDLRADRGAARLQTGKPGKTPDRRLKSLICRPCQLKPQRPRTFLPTTNPRDWLCSLPCRPMRETWRVISGTLTLCSGA